MELKDNPLPQGKSEPLKVWLRQSEFDTLIDVLKSKAFVHEVEAMNARAEVTEANGMQEKVVNLQKKADTINATVKLLESIRTETSFTTSTAKP